MATKKNIIKVSSALFVILLLILIIQGTCNYDAHGYCWYYWDLIGSISQFMLIVLPFFVFSLATYKAKDEVFEIWLMYSKWWVPLTLFIGIMLPENDPSLLPVDRKAFLLISTVFYTAISLFLIANKSYKLRGK